MAAGDDALPPMRVEAEGENVGEAKWAAVKALERNFPGLRAEAVTFDVLVDPEGTGERARVAAEVDVPAWEREAAHVPEEPTERVRAIVERVASALGLRASVDVHEDADEIRATVNGEDLGILIGRHGSTIDALQHLTARAAFRGEAERKTVIVDAAGYRERREAALRRAADRAVEEALSKGEPVALEPMGSVERRAVHRYLAERTDVQTHSEGDEPERRLVVTPVLTGS